MVLNLTLLFLSLSTVPLQFITTPRYSSSQFSGSFFNFYQIRCSRFVEPFYYTSARANILFQNSQFSHFLSTPLIFQSDDMLDQTFNNTDLQVTDSINISNCKFNYCCSANAKGGGAIYSTKSDINLTIYSCEFNHCTHTASSGVLYVQNNGKNSILFNSCTINNCSASFMGSEAQLITFTSENELNPVTLSDTSIEFWYPETVKSIDGQLITSNSDWQLYTNSNCTIMNKRSNLGFLYNNARNANLTANYLVLDNFYCEYLVTFLEGAGSSSHMYDFSDITVSNLTQNFQKEGSASVFYFDIDGSANLSVSNLTFSNITAAGTHDQYLQLYTCNANKAPPNVSPDIKYSEIIVYETIFATPILTPTEPINDQGGNTNLSKTTMIAIICVIIIVFVIAAVLIIVFVLHRKRRNHQTQSEGELHVDENETITCEVEQSLQSNPQNDPFKEDLKNALNDAVVI